MNVTPRFDEIIHAPHRLRICAFLATLSEAEFGTLRDHLGVADSVLSKHLKVLAGAGYVELAKPVGTGGRMRTWVSLTREGRRAFRGHLAELQRMASAGAHAPSGLKRPAGPVDA